MKRGLRAASALEYLATYGIAILVIAVLLVTLLKIGVFDSSAVTQNICAPSQGYTCSQSVLNTAGALSAYISETGHAVTVTSAACTTNSTLAGATFYALPNQVSLFSGEQHSFTFFCPSAGLSNSVGVKFNGYLWIKYNTAYSQGTTAMVAHIDTYTQALSTSTTTIAQSYGGNYIWVTLQNSQSSATPTPFQQSVAIDPASYSSAEASNLGNIRFYVSNAPAISANELYSWCELGCTSSSTNAVFWVKLPSGIGASSSVILNMTFNTVTTNSVWLQYDRAHAGESPQQAVTGYNNVATNYPIVNTSGSLTDSSGADSTVTAPDGSATLAICAGALSSASVGIYNDYISFDYGSDVNDNDADITNIGTQSGGGSLECNDYSGNGYSDPVGTSLVSVRGDTSYTVYTASSYGQTGETDLYFTVTTYNAFVVVAAACGFDDCANGGGDTVTFPSGCSLETSQSDGTDTESTAIATCELIPGSYEASAFNNNGDSEMALAAYVFQNYSVVSTPLNYGKYDNGQNVFDYYENGSTTSSWTVDGTSGTTPSAPSGSPFGANSFYANGAGGDYMYGNSGISTSGNYIIQYYVNSGVLGDLFFMANSAGKGAMSRIDTRGSGAGLADTASWSSWDCPAGNPGLSPSTWYMMQIDSIAGSQVGNWYSAALSYEGSLSVLDSISTTFSGCGGTQTYSSLASGGYIGLVGDGGGGITYVNGLIVRKYPPGGTMPSVTLSALH